MNQSLAETNTAKPIEEVLNEKGAVLEKIGAMVDLNIPAPQPEYKLPTADQTGLISLQNTDMKTMGKSVDGGITKAAENADPKLVAAAKERVNLLLSKDYDSQSKRTAVDGLGLETQKKAARYSAMLQAPVKTLYRSKEGTSLGDGLVELEQKMLQLDPAKFGLSVKDVKTMLVKSKIGAAIARYWSKSESMQSVIGLIVKSLEQGAAQLQRDNETFAVDQEAMRQTTFELRDAILVVSLMDKETQRRLDSGEISAPDDKKFVINELQFPIRQRIMSLQQTLLSAQQTVISSGLMIDTNRQVIRATNDAITVSVMQLGNVLSLLVGLYHQRDQLDKIKGLNQATEMFMTIGSELLDEQVTEVNTLAAQCMISLDVIEACMAHTHSAVKKVSEFRENALRPMGDSIKRMDAMAASNDEVIKRVEKGVKARGALNLNV